MGSGIPPLPFQSRVFDPTGEELIAHFLKNHILHQPYPESGTIQEDTVFGDDVDPWDKFCNPREPYPWQDAVDSTSTPSLFLFTRNSNVGNTSKSSKIQKNRRAGNGTWHGTSSVLKVTSSADDETVVGPYRILSFRSLNGEETKGQWNMYEYGISPEAFPEIRKVSDWENQVVCRIKRDDSKSNVGGKVTKRKSSSKPPLPNKRRRTGSSEKPVVVVDDVSREPDQVCYEEVADSYGLSMDELFQGVEVECC